MQLKEAYFSSVVNTFRLMGAAKPGTETSVGCKAGRVGELMVLFVP